MKTDSKHDTSPPNPSGAADESVDFRRQAPSEEDVAALSGAKTGSSVLSWDELVRQQSAEDEVDLGSRDDVEFDSASDQDILRKVLAGEKPPSKVIPRSGSNPEVDVGTEPAPATKPKVTGAAPTADTVREFPTAASGKAPGSDSNLRATRIEDDDDASFQMGATTEGADSSSILSSLGLGSNSGVQSDVLGSGSRVDLLAHLRPKGGSGMISRTAKLPDASTATPGAGEAANFGDEFAEDDESSAVDLGSRPVVDMPFPLGVDSSVGSSVVGSRPRGGPGSSRIGGDSAAVDLMAADEFNLHRQPGMSSVADVLRGDSGHELPPTVPMSPVAMDRVFAWVGGSVVGLLVSAAVFAALYFGGIVRFESEELGKPNPAMAARNPTALTPAAGEELLQVSNRLKKSQDDLAQSRKQSDEAKANEKKANDELQASRAEQTKLAEQSQVLSKQIAGLKDEIQRVNDHLAASGKNEEQVRASAQKALKEAEDRLAELRAQQDAKIAAASKTVEDRVRAEAAEADAARKALAEFTHALSLKLADANLVTANAKPAELLVAVDKALQRRTTPTTAGSFDSLQADRLFSNGVRAYRDRDFASAEQALTSAAKANDRDARIRYMLGLARMQLGRHNDAQTDFYAAAALERQHQPSPRDVDEILARLPGSDRSIVGQYRP